MTDGSIPPTGSLLVVSPHMDDAALSCGALIARDEPMDVLTVFAGAPDPPRQGDWDRLCNLGDSHEAVILRLAEEREAFAGTGHRVMTLDLVEAQYLDDPRPLCDAVPIADAILDWYRSSPDGTVALPAGAGRSFPSVERLFGPPIGIRRARIKRAVGPIGRWAMASVNSRMTQNGPPVVHEDHRFVRDAALRALRDVAGARVMLYEEVPYLWGGAADEEVARVASGEGLTLSDPVVLPIDREAKARRLEAYRSQVPNLYKPGLPLDTPEGLPQAERYWWLTRGPGGRGG
jgi:LmbE family N-acetylglucosaminyl deacetylase